MGLDGVELVMEVEDHFGITIQDTTAERIRTVGDLVSLIHDRVSTAQRSYCPTLPAFLKLRASVRASSSDDSLRIRPRDKIAEILTPLQRRELWKRLENLLGTLPRQLRRPPALRNFLAASAVAMLFASVWIAAAIDFRVFPLTLAVAAIAIFCLHAFTVSFRVTPPQDWVTFGDVAVKIVGATMATKYLHLRSIDDIFVELRPIIVETLGVDQDEMVLSARFIEDLGVG
jgi:acyl carrier protein